MDIDNIKDFEFPEFLIEILKIQYGIEEVEKIIEGFKQKRLVSLRVNTLKSNINLVKKALEKAEIEYENVLWSKEALIIKNADEKKIENMEIYKNGEIYMQSLSSMLPPIILNPKEGSDILDMCAAPGGKTTQIAALTSNKANITACEMNKIRAQKLEYNIAKQGANSVFVMAKDARFIDNFFSFDNILLDAPCSGSGTINIYDKNSMKSFSMQLIKKSASSQYALLKKALNILKPGQEMVYSTCSILEIENEAIIAKVLKETKAEIVPIEFENKESLPLLPVKIEGTICVCPSKYYEGFFIAKIRKKKL